MAAHSDQHDSETRLQLLERDMQRIMGNGRPGLLDVLLRWVAISVILSALALGTRAYDLFKAFSGAH